MTTMLRTSRMGTAALLVLALPFEVTTADDLPLTVDAAAWQNAIQQVSRGRKTFRFDTFGDEEFWGGALRLHEAIAGDREWRRWSGLESQSSPRAGAQGRCGWPCLRALLKC